MRFIPMKDQREGFTLIEVILSIAILSIVSVVALRLFILSADLNEEAQLKDLANIEATNLMEDLRSYDSLTQLLVEKNWLLPETSHYIGYHYYDGSFVQTSEENAHYILSFLLKPTQTVNLYDVEVQVVEKEDSRQALAFYASQHYFQERSLP